MIVETKKDAASRMAKTIETLKSTLTRIRTGRANADLLDHVMISYYGSDVPISQAGSVSVADARSLVVTPWEKKMIPDIEKAIMNSGLGLNPVTSGDVIRIPLPPLTEERRLEMTKTVRNEVENAKVAVRNVRRDANQHFKVMVKNKEVSEDEERKAEADVQKITDKHVADIDEILAAKEAELMEI
jgi:ribosome recycling factor